MAKSTRPADRPRFPVGRQIFVALATGAVALAALSNALGNTIGPAYPSLASAQLGADPTIPLKAALVENRDGNLRNMAGLAQNALKGQALNPLALAALGISKEQNGYKANRYIFLSDRQSRRIALAQLWLLEYSVNQGDVPGTLRRYDILMSVSSEYWGMLLPILDGALDSPDVTREFAKHLRTERLWTGNFFGYMLTRSPKPERLGRLVLLSGGIPHARSMGLDSGRLFDQLATAGRTDMLKALYLSDPAAKREFLTAPILAEDAFAPAFAPITWQLPPSSSIAVFPERMGNSYSLRVISDPPGSAKALRKLLFLAPGRYQLNFAIETLRTAPEATATWTISCVGGQNNPTQTHAIDLSRSKRDGFAFSIPAGCRAAMLDMSAFAGSDQSGGEFLLNQISLRRVDS